MDDEVCLPRSEARVVLSGIDDAQDLLQGTDYLVALLHVEDGYATLMDRMYPHG